MDLLICIDDTDNIDSKGTGTIADELSELVKDRFAGRCGYVSRHQLLIHEDIPYTSHNSSMCFPCTVDDAFYEELVVACFEYLSAESAPESDPGLAVADVQNADGEALRSFGLDAKRRVITKKEAFDTALITGVYLKEAGGTGQGVIGALAGLGLRLWGNDGELKGEFAAFKKDTSYTVHELKDSMFIQDVRNENGDALSDSDMVYVCWKAKPSLSGGISTLFVKRFGDGWSTMEKDELRKFHGDRVYLRGCGHFNADVEEEQVDDRRSCYNCRYRRWIENGLICKR